MPLFPDYSPTVGKLVPICGVCCIFCSFNCNSPECIGCFVEDHCLCCYGQNMCCKVPRESLYSCIFFRSNCASGPCGFCLSNCQCCCLDARVAIPTGPKNPFILTVLGVTVSLKCQSVCRCCANLEQLYSDIRVPLPTAMVELPSGHAPTPTRESIQYEREKVQHKRANDMDAIFATIVSEDSTRDVGNMERMDSATDDAFLRVDTERN